MDIKQLVSSVVTHLTGETPDVTIDEDEFGAVITVVVGGKVSALIGKNGTTIDALRTLLKSLGYKDKHRVKLRINEKNS